MSASRRARVQELRVGARARARDARPRRGVPELQAERVLGRGACDLRVHARRDPAHDREAAGAHVSHHRAACARLPVTGASEGRATEKLQALQATAARDLLVPEATELGGFGFTIDGQLVNLDTLKFFEVLIALQKGRCSKSSVAPPSAGWCGRSAPGGAGSLSVQDALPERHLSDQRLSRAVPLFGDVSDDAVPRARRWVLG